MTEDGKYGDNCFHDNRDDLDTVVMDTLVLSFSGNPLMVASSSVKLLNKTSQSVFQVIHLVDKDKELAKYDCRYFLYLSLCVRKPKLRVPTRSDTNQAVQSQKMARGLKFCI